MTATAQPIGDVARRKSVATWQARYALAGFELVELADATFIVQRWGFASRPMPDLAAVARFAYLVGVRAEG